MYGIIEITVHVNYMELASQKELAEVLGFSQAWVSKLIRNLVDQQSAGRED